METQVKTQVKKGVNFLDILPVAPQVDVKSIDVDVYSKIKSDVDAFRKLNSSYPILGLNIKQNQFIQNINLDIAVLRKSNLFAHGIIPQAGIMSYSVENLKTNTILETKDEDILKISNCPILHGHSIKDLVNKFNFIFMPIHYVDKSIFELEGVNKQQVHNFKEKFELFGYNIYVVCPVGFYNIQSHVDSKTDLGIYAGKNSIMFSSILVNIPMFRELKKSITLVNGKVDNIVKSMDVMSTQIKAIELQLKEQLIDNIKQKETIAILNSRLNDLQHQQLFNEISSDTKLEDPIMIAVPSDTDVNSKEFDSSICKVGPCWGPDFDENVALALGYSTLKSQRETINKYHVTNFN